MKELFFHTELNAGKGSWTSFSFFLFFFITFTSYSQIPTNLGFEDGTTYGWTCKYGKRGHPTIFASCDTLFAARLNSVGCINKHGENAPLSSTSDLHVITNGNGLDSNSLFQVPLVAPSSLFLNGTNNYSFRIGNGLATIDDSLGADVQSIERTFVVNRENAKLTYMYAVLAEYADHPDNQLPYFQVKITRQKNGKEELIICSFMKKVNSVTKKDSNWKTGKKSADSSYWNFMDWQKVTVNLASYLGETVTLEFSTCDCIPGTTTIACPNNICQTGCSFRGGGVHPAYAYIDLYASETGETNVFNPFICANSSQQQIALCAPAGYDFYEWPLQKGIPQSDSVQCINVNNIFPQATYSVNMRYINSNCTDVRTETITIKNLANLKVNPSQICSDSNTVLTATGAATYTWSPTTLEGTSIQVHPSSPTTTLTYTLLGTSMEGCTNTTKISIPVRNCSLPFVVLKDTFICSGCVTLTPSIIGGTFPYSYAWNTGETTAVISVCSKTTNSYTLTVKDNKGLITSNFCTVKVRGQPQLNINKVTICAGETATLNATGANEYSWNTNISGSILVDTPTTSTNYTVVGTDLNGCTNSESTSVTVHALPNITTANTYTCSGKSATLVATGADSYRWSNGLNDSSITVSPISTTNYQVTGTNSAGCSKSAQAIVTIYQFPHYSPSPTNICIYDGNKITFDGHSSAIYQWIPNDIDINGELKPQTLGVNTYSLIPIAGPCIDTSVVDFTVYNCQSQLIINVAPVEFCRGKSGIATVTSDVSTPLLYTWSNGKTTNKITVYEDTIYTVTVQDTSIHQTASAKVLVKVRPMPHVTVSNPGVVCKGQSYTLTASGAVDYLWYNSSPDSIINIIPDENTHLFVYGYNAMHDCIDTLNFQLAMDSSRLSATNVTVCRGDKGVMEASGADSYLWSNGLTTASIEELASHTTSYSVTGMNSHGCIGKKQVWLIVHDVPSITASSKSVCKGTNATITANGGLSYLWSTGESSSAIKVSVDSTTFFSVVGTGDNGCKDTVQAKVEVAICTGLQEQTAIWKYKIFPNPAFTQVTIEVEVIKNEQLHLHVLNVMGELLFSEQIIKNQHVLDVSKLSPGIYMIELSTNKNRAIQKLIIQD